VGVADGRIVEVCDALMNIYYRNRFVPEIRHRTPDP